MKLIEIIKDGKKILIGEGEKGIESPIEIKFTMDENDFNKIEKAAMYYKWSIYDAIIEILTRNPEGTLRKAEMEYQGIANL